MKVIKKDGTLEEFDGEKIVNAVNKSASRVMITLDDTAFHEIVGAVLAVIKEKGLTDIPVATMHNIVEQVSKCFPFCTTVLNNPVSGLKLQGHNITGISLLNTRRAVALLILSKVKPSFLKLYSLIIQDLLYSVVFCFQTPGRAGTLAA